MALTSRVQQLHPGPILSTGPFWIRLRQNDYTLGWVSKPVTKKGKDATTSTEQLDARLTEIERKLDRLKALYETYFMGVERTAPSVPRREANRLILEIQQEYIGNASMRFRLQSILQRWVLFTTYWNRTMREIEAGTYRRDVARAQRHLAQRGGAITEHEAIALGIPQNRVKAFVERQQKMVKPGATAQARSTPATPAIPGVNDREMEALYRKYLDTHSQAKDPRPALTFDKIKDRLRTQVPRILADRNCSKVRLDVAVEDGKVRLKAFPVDE
jgi:hypothetical protein